MGSRSLSTDEFIDRAKRIHGELFDYSETNYTRIRDKVTIFCKRCLKHFEQFAYNHLCGNGCNYCRASRGERRVRILLDLLKINYAEQVSFDECRDKGPLRFDFYLPEERILIEYDGLQHSQPVDFFGGEKAYESLVRRDQIKDDFAEATGMKLIRISGLQNVFLGVMNGILAHSSGSPSFGATCV